MKVEPIAGFDALKFKKEAQEAVQSELRDLSFEEKQLRIRESVETGPLGAWWKRLRAAEIAKQRAELERMEAIEKNNAA